jgi:hypothetical protein
MAKRDYDFDRKVAIEDKMIVEQEKSHEKTKDNLLFLNSNGITELSYKNIHSALLQVQKELPDIKRNKENKHYKYSYADLSSVLETCLPILNKHGVLFYTKQVKEHPDFLTVILHHTESDTIKLTDVPLIGCIDMQKTGSAITYATRYGLLCLIGKSPSNDDDGDMVRHENISKTFNKVQTPFGLDKIKNDVKVLWDLKKDAAFDIDSKRYDYISSVIDSGIWPNEVKLKQIRDWLQSL